jgi:hypothetical protein
VEALPHQHRVKEKVNEEIATRQWRVSEGQILVYDPGLMWKRIAFLIAGMSLAF